MSTFTFQKLQYYKRVLVRACSCSYYNRFPKPLVNNVIDEHRIQKQNWMEMEKEGRPEFTQKHYDKSAQTKLDSIDFFPGQCLEIGCESGWFGQRVLEKYPAAKYVGVDFRYEEITAPSLPGHYVINGDACRLPLKKNTMDLLIGFHVLEHLRDIKGFAGELDRVLKDDAKVLFCVPIGWDDDPCHRWHFMTAAGWKRFIMRRFGLRQVSHVRISHEPGEYMGLFERAR
ncbi:MAG: class I SAM-dependent methyltransferase [Fibrobacteria bacterium]|nr:class I SAM-dependent methyltransferase [Fibrobacteria bacterium]